MPPPALFVMSTEATGPRSDRRPAGVVHAAPTTHPPVNTTLCGQAHGLYWFGHVRFGDVEGDRCAQCVGLAEAIAKLAESGPGPLSD